MRQNLRTQLSENLLRIEGNSNLYKLRFTTIQAPNQDFIIRELATYAGERMGIPTEFAGDPSWQARERLFDSGQVEVAWICGLPYVWKVDRDERNETELRVLTSLGPSSIPPLVIRKEAEPAMRAALRRVLTEMHHNQAGRRILNAGNIKRLEAVKDEDYDLIREMEKQAELVEL